jgi:hypothetical protein
LLTSSNKIIHIENAVELNQGVQPRIAEDGQGNKGGDNAPPKSTGRTKPPRK